ncbi:MAG TPA: hypothetical protein PKD56_07725, partial [Chitinophagales bacterium]|nr:hypothetical protein [Chitinophagales bacterium]
MSSYFLSPDALLAPLPQRGIPSPLSSQCYYSQVFTMPLNGEYWYALGLVFWINGFDGSKISIKRACNF